MSGEVAQNFEENRDKYKDFRDALSDSHLDQEEKAELTDKYYSECAEVHTETQDVCEELRKELDFYKEMTDMSRDEISRLQILS